MEDDILQLLSLVAEANRLAAYMNRDSAFELQLKTFTFDSMTGEGVKEHDKHYGHHLEIQKPYGKHVKQARHERLNHLNDSWD